MEKTVTNSKPANPQVMRSFKDNKSGSSPMKAIGIFVFLMILGVVTGFFLSKNPSTVGNKTSVLQIGGPAKGKTFGSDDTKTFKDTAEGKLENGGIEGEGQYHLVRPGGDSQNVYLTSSSVDLSQFIGKKIKVWGQTQTAQTAGWLMDVGRVEVL